MSVFRTEKVTVVNSASQETLVSVLFCEHGLFWYVMIDFTFKAEGMGPEALGVLQTLFVWVLGKTLSQALGFRNEEDIVLVLGNLCSFKA